MILVSNCTAQLSIADYKSGQKWMISWLNIKLVLREIFLQLTIFSHCWLLFRSNKQIIASYMLHPLILKKSLIQFKKLLWQILLKNGIKGKLYRSVKSMFDDGKARVRCAKFCDFISCTRGVKLADTCSPVLFSLYVNDLPLEIINNGRHDATLNQMSQNYL